jgi:cold shock protein
MASKIPESEWGAVVARRNGGEAVASIARSYGCSPALVYSILRRQEGTTPAEEAESLKAPPVEEPAPAAAEAVEDLAAADQGEESAAADRSEDLSPTDEDAEVLPADEGEEFGAEDPDDGFEDDGEEEPAARPPALAARLDDDLRQDVEAAIHAFTSAFDAALEPGGGKPAQAHLHAAASALMRAGARTIIVIERFGAAPAAAAAPQQPQPARPPGGAPAPVVPKAEIPIPAGPVEGTVKWFKPAKRFGFIAVEGTGDIYVHLQALERSGLSSLQPGQRVRLTIGAGAKGPQANTVELI